MCGMHTGNQMARKFEAWCMDFLLPLRGLFPGLSLFESDFLERRHTMFNQLEMRGRKKHGKKHGKK